jgi:hypothetical protein
MRLFLYLLLMTGCQGAPEPASPTPSSPPEAVPTPEEKAVQWAVAEHLEMEGSTQLNLSVELSPNTGSFSVAKDPDSGLCFVAYKAKEDGWTVVHMSTSAPPSPAMLMGEIQVNTVGAMADRDEVGRMFTRCLGKK